MSIFDKNENEKYAYFLTNFKETPAVWVVMINYQFIKSSLDNSSTKLFGMNVDKSILFFDINLDANNELHELGIIKESYSIDLTNDLDFNLGKKINNKNEGKNYDLIYNQIDNFFIEDSELLKFCEYTLNITNLSTETDGPTISAFNNYKSVAFNSYPTKIYELLDWFGIEIVDASNNGLKVNFFCVKDNSAGSNSEIRRKPILMSNKTLKNIDNDDKKINK